MILLIKYMVQTVRVFVHPVLLSLSRGKRLYLCHHDRVPIATKFKFSRSDILHGSYQADNCPVDSVNRD